MIVDGNTYCRVITPILPPEYQEVEYIESGGNQYIDTGYVPNQNTEFEVEYELNKQGTYGIIFGGEQGYNNNAFHMYVSGNPKKWDIGFDKVYIYAKEVEFNKKIKYKINKTSYYFDNVEYTYISNPTFDNARAVYLFADNRSSVLLDVNAQKKIYKCSIKDNNTLVRNFIPCYRKSDNVIGMYDTVNKVFYTNQGTGTFLKGNNVVHTIRYKIPTEERPYISGHVTDGSSTFTFKVNSNQSITVPVDSNGNWKWYVDRTITTLVDSFKQKNNIDKLFIYDKLNDCQSLYGMFTDASALQEVEFRNAIFNKVTTTAYMFNRAYALTKLKLPNAQFDSLATASNMFIDVTNLETIEIKSFKISLNLRWQSKLTEQSVVNLINAAAANVTYTLHSTVYNKCKSGGEWYTDIQAAIDAKAQQGYTVTLISA